MSKTDSNPLLDAEILPDFTQLQAAHIEPAIDRIIADYRALVVDLSELANPDFESFVRPMEEASDRLHRMWSPVSHLNAVRDSEALRSAYDGVLPKLTEIGTELGQNPKLLAQYQKIRDAASFANLSIEQQRVIDNAIRDFELAGVSLADKDKQRVADINRELADLSNRFSKNVLDATLAWNMDVSDENRLKGLPESDLQRARRSAEDAGLSGYRFSLQAPSYISVVTHVEDRELRRRMYEAYVTRASDQGPVPDKFDNSEIIAEVLRLRSELAGLIGFDNFADYSLATKMARTPDEVVNFLLELSQRSRPSAMKDFKELADFARQRFDIERLEAWDMAFVSEQLRREKFDFDQELVRPWFPVDKVLSGLFEVAQRLFSVEVIELEPASSWHEDVRYFEIKDLDGTHRGAFYIDLYARDHKRGGAWIAPAVTRRQSATVSQTPVAFLTCNFSPAVADNPVLLRHGEVITLFHEFGHGLHHMLTRVDCAAVSGISGVEWDAVELPSQFLENWCWNPESLRVIARHHESGEPLPEDLLQRMLDARNFQSGLQMLRQIEFALFDMRLHSDVSNNTAAAVQNVLDQVRNDVSVAPTPEFNRFQNGFSHIFAGGYAAGYYSYKWAEVLSADAFSLFEERGVFDQQTGQAFCSAILEKGGSRDAMDLFVDFRGREPDVEALLRHSGL